jgi:hypothetical protein
MGMVESNGDDVMDDMQWKCGMGWVLEEETKLEAEQSIE